MILDWTGIQFNVGREPDFSNAFTSTSDESFADTSRRALEAAALACREAIDRPLNLSVEITVPLQMKKDYELFIETFYFDRDECHENAGGSHRWRLNGSRWATICPPPDAVDAFFTPTKIRIATRKRCVHCGKEVDA